MKCLYRASSRLNDGHRRLARRATPPPVCCKRLWMVHAVEEGMPPAIIYHVIQSVAIASPRLNVRVQHIGYPIAYGAINPHCERVAELIDVVCVPYERQLIHICPVEREPSVWRRTKINPCCHPSSFRRPSPEHRSWYTSCEYLCR